MKEIYEGCSFVLAVTDPRTYEEAVKLVGWREAINDEIKAIEKNKSLSLCELPAPRMTIGVKWVYRTKYKPDGEVQKYKAILVAKGYV